MSSGCGENKIRRRGIGTAVGVVGKCLVTYCSSDYSGYLVFRDFRDTEEPVHLFRNNSPGHFTTGVALVEVYDLNQSVLEIAIQLIAARRNDGKVPESKQSYPPCELLASSDVQELHSFPQDR
jgi:hypothetical protein